MTTTNDLHAASYDVLTLVINLSAEFYGKIIRTNAGIHSCEHVINRCSVLLCSVLLYSQMYM